MGMYDEITALGTQYVEGKLVKVENEALNSRATLLYRGFAVVYWGFSYCIRPLEVGHIPDEMLDAVEFRRFERSIHFLLDGTETACLYARVGCSLEEVLAHIDSWWARLRGQARVRG